MNQTPVSDRDAGYSVGYPAQNHEAIANIECLKVSFESKPQAKGDEDGGDGVKAPGQGLPGRYMLA